MKSAYKKGHVLCRIFVQKYTHGMGNVFWSNERHEYPLFMQKLSGNDGGGGHGVP